MLLLAGSIIILIVSSDASVMVNTVWRNGTINSTGKSTNITNSSTQLVKGIEQNDKAVNILVHSDRIITYIFFIEILIRFITSPSRCEFVKSIFNWIDIITVVPWTFIALSIHVSGEDFSEVVLNSGLNYYLQFTGTMRAIRLITLARHHVASLVFLVTLWES